MLYQREHDETQDRGLFSETAYDAEIQVVIRHEPQAQQEPCAENYPLAVE